MSDQPNMPVSTAVVSWSANGSTWLRVYSCDGYNVTEMSTETGQWAATGFTAPGSDVSATCWQDSNGLHFRVYCTIDDTTTEWCNDGGASGNWYQGQYTQP